MDKELPKNEIIQGDALEELKNLPDESVDMVVTSPPYYTGQEYEEENKNQEGYENYVEFLESVFQETYRIIKKGGHLWINIDDVHTSIKSEWGVNRVLPTHALLIKALHKRFIYKEMVLWRKIRGKHASGGANRMLGSYGRFGSPGSIPIVQEVEYILWFKKPGKREDITDEMRKESTLSGDEFKKYGMQIWDIDPVRGQERIHPAPFPEEIPHRIIKLGTFKGDLVLDPFMGGGTTAVVARKLDRDYLGIELNPDYIEIVQYRLAQQILNV